MIITSGACRRGIVGPRTAGGYLKVVVKGGDERPAVPIPPGAVTMLRSMAKPSGPVWTYRKGNSERPYTGPYPFKHYLAKARQITGLTWVTFHKMRHNYAIWGLDAGKPIDQVSQGMGHASVQTTQQWYGEYDNRVARDVSESVAAAIGDTITSVTRQIGHNAGHTRKLTLVKS